MKKAVINVNFNVKCKQCGKGGATQSGYCMRCITEKIQRGDFNHILKPRQDKKREDTRRL